jgi:hypothetical protein
MSKAVVRHLDGSVYKETDSTNYGAYPRCWLVPLLMLVTRDIISPCTGTTMQKCVTSAPLLTLALLTATRARGCTRCSTTLWMELTSAKLPPDVCPNQSKLSSHGAGGGEGECLKILQVENGLLPELVEASLSLTHGFGVPAGTVVLLGSPSYAANTGTADYSAEFVRVSGQFRGAFSGGENILRDSLSMDPFALG